MERRTKNYDFQMTKESSVIRKTARRTYRCAFSELTKPFPAEEKVLREVGPIEVFRGTDDAVPHDVSRFLVIFLGLYGRFRLEGARNLNVRVLLADQLIGRSALSPAKNG